MDFYEKLRSGYYTNTKDELGEPPVSPFTEYKNIEAEVKANFRGTFDEIMIEIEKQKAAYKETYDEYWKKSKLKSAELEEEFVKDLYDEYGVTDNPKANLCYSKAWDSGHSYGLSEVHTHFSNLVDLIK
jgi:hypothetical protein